MKGISMILECKACEALVNAEFVASYNHEDKNWGTETYSLYKCPKCEKPLLTYENASWGLDRLYPQEVNRINPDLPEPLKAAYEEALACFKSKAYTATAIMCRKTLEGICIEHGAKGRNLVSSLKELKDKGVIENRLYEWADALRISGNEAAHDVSVTISAEDAGDILEFTNALLEYVFTFHDRFEEFKMRRDNKTRT
jgi:hypothetical protein